MIDIYNINTYNKPKLFVNLEVAAYPILPILPILNTVNYIWFLVLSHKYSSSEHESSMSPDSPLREPVSPLEAHLQAGSHDHPYCLNNLSPTCVQVLSSLPEVAVAGMHTPDLYSRSYRKHYLIRYELIPEL